MHNFVYYLYTGHVNMHNLDQNPSHNISIPKGFPHEVDPFQLYIASNMYLEEFLEEQCFQYLLRTCTPENICDRLFTIACRPYEKLTKAYRDFIVHNYYEVKFRKGWSTVYKNMTSCSTEEIEFFSDLLFNISISDALTEEDSEDDEDDESVDEAENDDLMTALAA